MISACIVSLCAADCDAFGASVVAAFGEYCGQRHRLVLQRPHLARKPELLARLTVFVMRYDEWSREVVSA